MSATVPPPSSDLPDTPMTSGTPILPRDNLPRESHRPTLADVARACGMSKSSVSIALSQPPEKCALKAETRQHIVDVASKMGYRPHWLARNLGTRRTQSVAVLYNFRMPLTNGIYERLVMEFNHALAQSGFQSAYLRLSTDNPDWRYQFEDGRFEGGLVIGSCDQQLLRTLEGLPVPVVAVNVDPDINIPQVLFDDAGGMAQAMNHLFTLGHRRISYYRGGRPSAHVSVEVRERGYRDAMTAAGLTQHIDVAAGSVDDFAVRFSDRRSAPTAIVTYAHEEAVALLRRLQQRGYSLPRDVSLIAINDVYPLHELFPAITAVRVPSDIAGFRAARTLLSLMDRGKDLDKPVTPLWAPLPPGHILTTANLHNEPREDDQLAVATTRVGDNSVLLSEQLIVRESTAPPPPPLA